MRYFTLLFFVLFFLNIHLPGQIQYVGHPLSSEWNVKSNISYCHLEANTPVQERSKPKLPLVAGYTIPFDAGDQKYGTWTELPDGSAMWQLGIHVKGAKATNVYLRNLRLTGNDKLFIYFDTASDGWNFLINLLSLPLWQKCTAPSFTFLIPYFLLDIEIVVYFSDLALRFTQLKCKIYSSNWFQTKNQIFHKYCENTKKGRPFWTAFRYEQATSRDPLIYFPDASKYVLTDWALSQATM